MKKIILTGLSALLAIAISAQDIHYSQFTASPLNLNPAFAGNNECDFRLTANMRGQYLGASATGGFAYKTFNFGADFNMGRPTKYSNFAGVGLNLFADLTGDANYNTYRGELNLAYHIMLDRYGSKSLSFGMQAGLGYRSINQSKITTNNQFDGVFFDPNIPAEQLARYKYTYIDASLGVLYSIRTRTKKNYYIGMAVNHLNQPNQGMLGEQDRLFIRYTWHAGMNFPIGDRFGILPSGMLLLQHAHVEANLGGYYKIKFDPIPSHKNAIYIGAWARFNNQLDALVIATRLDVKKFNFGLSYDINLMKVKNITGTIGGPELSVIYTGCYNKKARPIICPVL